MSKVKTKRNKLGSFATYMRRHWGLYAMLVLPITFFLIFSYWPMINILIAFMRNNTIIPVWNAPWERWVGLENFRWLMDNIQFQQAFRNTIMFSFLDLALGFPLPIILALLLNEIKFKRFKRVTQTITYMPFFLSWIIIGGMATRLFRADTGAINVLLGTSIPFLSDSTHWVFTNVFTAIWRGLGWNTIIYLAAITAVNPELYEAADLDGASRLQKMWHVTLPGIRPVIMTLLILTLGGIMNADMARFLAMENRLVADVSMVFPIFVYRWGIQGAQFHRAAAAGLVSSLLNLVFLLTANFVSRKATGSGLW